MNILITLDYELFFGNAGTLENCILKPTRAFVEVLDRYNCKGVFFVDAGYLIRLEKYKDQHATLAKDHQELSAQIKWLHDNGHDIQLHIHPHWEDTHYENGEWRFDLSRYRLDSFEETEILDIFKRYQAVLTNITGQKPTAYRAGGWCIQPFSKLKPAFEACGMVLDSTVFYKGKNDSPQQWYDFTSAKDLDFWRFEDDPCKEEKQGQFWQYPIASYRVSPFFFWKFTIVKLLKQAKHKAFGDGSASVHTKGHYVKLLTQWTNSVVSIDGYKARFLQRAFNKYNKAGKKHFVIIGHPKAFTPYSLNTLNNFLSKNNTYYECRTFQELLQH